jgi:serine phosphatase RsbU (regulator of sigma subunit)
MAGVLAEDGLSVTLFHGRLDLGSGMLRYVNAGGGRSAVRRADGEVVRLAERSLPLGATGREDYEEAQVRLEPGDTLLAYTDGLVETTGGTVDVEELAGSLGGVESAEVLVRRLVGRVRGRQSDDATVVLLRRAARRSRRPRTSGPADSATEVELT